MCLRHFAEIGLGATDDALADLRAAAAASPELPEAQFNLATLLHRTGRHAEALPLLTRAVELRPNFVAAWIARAETSTPSAGARRRSPTPAAPWPSIRGR